MLVTLIAGLLIDGLPFGADPVDSGQVSINCTYDNSVYSASAQKPDIQRVQSNEAVWMRRDESGTSTRSFILSQSNNGIVAREADFPVQGGDPIPSAWRNHDLSVYGSLDGNWGIKYPPLSALNEAAPPEVGSQWSLDVKMRGNPFRRENLTSISIEVIDVTAPHLMDSLQGNETHVVKVASGACRLRS